MIEKELLSIVETLKEVLNILLIHEIEVFTDHKNLTYETIESSSQTVQRWESLMQEFVVTLLYIKGEANLVADGFSLLTMAHHAHKLADTTLEEDTCQLLCLNSLFIFDNTDFFPLGIEEISFPLAPQIVKAEYNLELQSE